MRRPALSLLVLALLLPTGAAGQRNPPPRPPLEAPADTNDAAAYHNLAVARLRTDARQAGNAFYWAQRLDPTRPEPYYGQRIAILLQNPRRLHGYMSGTRSVLRSREVQEADSLFNVALSLFPMMFREFDRHLIDGYVKETIRQIQNENPSVQTGDLDHYMNQVMSRAAPDFRGWLAYTDRRFPQALDLYAMALRDSRRKAWLHADRSHVYFLVGNLESAESEMSLALDDMRRHDKDNRVFLYESKEFYEISYGIILEARGKLDEAEAAYGRALQENLSYHPAHRRSALLMLQKGDTTAALSSLALGAAIETAGVALLMDYAALLLATGDLSTAIAQLNRVIAREPWYAAPHALLGQAFEEAGRTADAAAAYDAFLARASRAHTQRGDVTQKLQALRGGT